MTRAHSSRGKPATPVPMAGNAMLLMAFSSARIKALRVARRSESAVVRPPSFMLAAWITYSALRFPPVVTAAAPKAMGPMRSHSSSIRGPPLRRIAPATPAPRIRSLLAALTIASTATSVMSPLMKWILAGIADRRILQPAISRASRARSVKSVQAPIDNVQVESLRIEGTSHPFQQFFVPLVLWIGHRLEQLFVTSDSAAILGRAGARASKTHRILRSGFGAQSFLDDNVMQPAVAHVIFVPHAALGTGDHIGQGRFGFAPHFGAAEFREYIARGEVLPANHELMQMRIGPAQDMLQDHVELSECGIARHVDTPPDRRPDSFESHLNLINLDPVAALFEGHVFPPHTIFRAAISLRPAIIKMSAESGRPARAR